VKQRDPAIEEGSTALTHAFPGVGGIIKRRGRRRNGGTDEKERAKFMHKVFGEDLAATTGEPWDVVKTHAKEEQTTGGRIGKAGKQLSSAWEHQKWASKRWVYSRAEP